MSVRALQWICALGLGACGPVMESEVYSTSDSPIASARPPLVFEWSGSSVPSVQLDQVQLATRAPIFKASAGVVTQSATGTGLRVFGLTRALLGDQDHVLRALPTSNAAIEAIASFRSSSEFIAFVSTGTDQRIVVRHLGVDQVVAQRLVNRPLNVWLNLGIRVREKAGPLLEVEGTINGAVALSAVLTEPGLTSNGQGGFGVRGPAKLDYLKSWGCPSNQWFDGLVCAVPGPQDLCPDDPAKTDPGVCGCGVADVDTDGDGSMDCLDGCPADPSKTASGVCGCGVADVDTDGDGSMDCLDGCPLDPSKTASGVCGCGVSDVDSDLDGTPDCLEPPVSAPRVGHSATLLTDGRIVAIGGGSALAQNYDSVTNTWSQGGTAQSARSRHSSVVLQSGKLFIAGGSVGGVTTGSSEIYDPWAQTFASGPNLNRTRESHTVTRLNNGKVLLVGGIRDSTTYLNTCELYNPSNGTIALTGALVTARANHTANLLSSGQVLVCGGRNGSGALSSCEVYDPTAGTWTATGALLEARRSHTATALTTGKILAVGGQGTGALGTAELYDPASGTWSPVAAMSTPRSSHGATLLPWGSILVTGGFGASGNLSSTEVYDPELGTWTAGPTLTEQRREHTATLLPTGSVALLGGMGGPNGAPLASVDRVNLSSPSPRWVSAAAPARPRVGSRAVLLNTGKVLLVGGQSGNPCVADAELYDPSNNQYGTAGTLLATRCGHSATLLPNGKVFIAGGVVRSTTELYAPSTNAFTSARSLLSPRTGHTATLLPNGKVLLVGGFDANGYLASAELYDHVTNTVVAGGAMGGGRAFHTATLLPNGKVLIAGGPSSTAELYDPATNTFALTGSLSTVRQNPTATLLPNGRVLLAGGLNPAEGALRSAEIYDPATGSFVLANSMTSYRSSHTASLLNNGKVLMAGGQPLLNAELYDPATNTFSDAGMMGAVRSNHSATLLPNGKVFLAGGETPFWDPASAELYDPRQPVAQPVVRGPATAAPGETITLGVSGLRGPFEGSSGDERSSPAHHPVVTISAAHLPRVADFSTTQVKVTLPCGVPLGDLTLTLSVSGVSTRVPMTIVPGACSGL